MHTLLCRCMDLTYNEYCNYISSICFYCKYYKYCKYSICSLIGPALLSGIAIQPCSGSPVGFMEPCLIQAWLTPSQRSERDPHTDWLANSSCFRLPKFQSLPPKLSKTLYRLGLGSLSCDTARVCPKPQTVGLILCLSFVSACSSMVSKACLVIYFCVRVVFGKRAIHYQLLCHGWK